MYDIGDGRDVWGCEVFDEELFPGRCIMETGEQVVQNASTELRRLLERDIAECCVR